FTPKNVWPNSLLVDFPPSSETENHTVIFNLIINKEDDRDRILLLNPQTKPDTPLIIGVFQLGLGADRLQNSKDPETKAWIEFLTQAHLKKDIPAYTPDSVAAAYGTLDLHHWPEALKTQYYDSLLPQKPLTQKELGDVIAIICFCLDRSYPLATMVKYTGLCPEVIKNILAKIKQMPGL
ncbi:MAG: hypothetical protein Q8R43_00200, partial [Alphaproteobacteria bacterium]|nr:hypothetical protein [Alphaproteobacteria bacterium]